MLSLAIQHGGWGFRCEQADCKQTLGPEGAKAVVEYCSSGTFTWKLVECVPVQSYIYILMNAVLTDECCANWWMQVDFVCFTLMTIWCSSGLAFNQPYCAYHSWESFHSNNLNILWSYSWRSFLCWYGNEQCILEVGKQSGLRFTDLFCEALRPLLASNNPAESMANSALPRTTPLSLGWQELKAKIRSVQ